MEGFVLDMTQCIYQDGEGWINNVRMKYGAEIADRCKSEIEKLFPISELDLLNKEHYRFVMKILNDLLQNEY